MTEAYADAFFEDPTIPAVVTEVVRPQLEVIQGCLPAFVQTDDDHMWWNRLPEWRRQLFMLPQAHSEEERIRQINALGMTVVSYASGRAPIRHYPTYE